MRYIGNLINKLWRHFLTNSLFRNSIYLMMATAVMAGFGFFFWLINARLFTSEEVGIGTTLISVAALISSFSLLGLGNSIIKYLPSSDRKNENINTAFAIVTVVTVAISVFFLLFLKTFSPQLFFVRENYFYIILFIFFVVSTSLNTILENIFIAYRSSVFVLIKNAILSLFKLGLPFLLVSFGVYGIFMAYGLGISVAVLFSLFLLSLKFGFSFIPKINLEIVRRTIKFSLGNYAATFMSGLPALLLPIIITNSVGAKFSAYYYVDMMIANFLYMIPLAVSQSLFAEGSYSEVELKDHFRKAIITILSLLVPAVIATLILGKYVLLAFGSEYSVEGITFLRILVTCALFFSVNYVCIALLYIKHKVKIVILINSVGALIVLGLSYLLIRFYLIGIGLAWLVGCIIVSAIYFLLLYFDKSISFPNSQSTSAGLNFSKPLSGVKVNSPK